MSRLAATAAVTVMTMAGAAVLPGAVPAGFAAANSPAALPNAALQTAALPTATMQNAAMQNAAMQNAATQNAATQNAAMQTAALQTLALDTLGGRVAGAALPERATAPFSLLGITWTDPRAAIGRVEVRTRAARIGAARIGAARIGAARIDAARIDAARIDAAGGWTGWQTLETDGVAAGDTRGATDPLWVGRSDGVQARVTGSTPAGLRLDLINPDAALPVNTARAGRLESSSVAMPARPVPRMVTRAGWGANEAIVAGTPEYTGPVDVFFVHHTATGNGYDCRDSASIVRGIQAYQVRSKGWDDIGYNFLVDKCANIFEGRVGGVGRSVLGAHTLGFNTDASAIAVIGNYDRVPVSSRVETAIATVAAYKLGAYGNLPDGRVVRTSGGSDRFPAGMRVSLNRISGHRDTGQTECPGTDLYRQLPAIRAIAGAGPAGLRLLRLTGSARYGPLFFTKGLVRPLWTVRTPSALINRFEVRVDGRLVLAAPGTHRTAPIRLSPGGHLVSVRAQHLSGRIATITSRVVADPNPPAFTAGPDVGLRTGSLNGSVPIRLNWTATDVNGLSAVTLLHPTAVDLGTTAHARNGTLRPGQAATLTVRAVDRAGNARLASVTRTPQVWSESTATRTGAWRVLRDPAYLGGVALGSTAAGSSATWTFTGRSAALAVGRGAASGRVRIVVDGQDQGTVDLRSATTVYRRAIWSRSWASGGRHSVRVEVQGPAVLDGLVVLS